MSKLHFVCSNFGKAGTINQIRVNPQASLFPTAMIYVSEDHEPKLNWENIHSECRTYEQEFYHDVGLRLQCPT